MVSSGGWLIGFTQNKPVRIGNRQFSAQLEGCQRKKRQFIAALHAPGACYLV